jgi:hypothetical protein
LEITELVSAFSAFGTLVVAIVATYLAFRQLNLWKIQSAAQQKSDAAIRLFNAACIVDDEIKSIRNPLTSIPEDKVSDKKYPFERRWESLRNLSQHLVELRRAEVLFRFLAGRPEVEKAVHELFSLYNELLRLKFQVQHPEPERYRMLRWTKEASTSAVRNVA